MSLKLAVYTNEDDALLFWSADELPNCLGFAIERKWTRPTGMSTQDFLKNRTGFEGQATEPGTQKPSTEWPFQCYSWTDHEVDTGDTVSYRIVPVMQSSNGPEIDENGATQWSPPLTLSANAGGACSAYFNRGFVISQFMSRKLGNLQASTLQAFKQQISQNTESEIRQFLSGDLRLALLRLLQETQRDGGTIFAALFELSDPELIAALTSLGARAHVVLSNGSVKKKGQDENDSARHTLADAGVQVFDRMVAPGALGHNKFMVRCDNQGKPIAAWTGSTNWAPTGLCTQVNNAILIADPGVAEIFMEQWARLRDSGRSYPPALVQQNSKPKEDAIGNNDVTVWFSRTSNNVDLQALQAEVDAAKEAILFLMFMPGASGLYSRVAARAAEPGLYVRGVVSELPTDRNDESQFSVNLVAGARNNPLHLDIIQPQGINHSFSYWAEEVSRGSFLRNIGHAIIHSKVVVIDPFSANPVVITGSHNFSVSASSKNDENFVIIRGNARLAQAYAVNIMGAYRHYNWRAYVSQAKKPWEGLKKTADWQKSYRTTERLREVKFWLGGKPAPIAAPPSAMPGRIVTPKRIPGLVTPTKPAVVHKAAGKTRRGNGTTSRTLVN